MSLIQEFQAFLSKEPLLLFLSIALLPGLGFPVSILFTIAGVVWGTSIQSCLIVIVALAINLTWTYWLMRSPIGGLARSLIPEKWLMFLKPEKSGALKLILLLRLTPGMPLFVQNYVLGLLRVPFLTYLPLSLFLSSLWACGFVVSGGAIFRGQIGRAIAGFSLLVVAVVVTKLIKHYSTASKS